MLVCKQKINFITYFFLKILQRNSKFVILGNLGMPGHTKLKWKYQFEENFDFYLLAKVQLYLHIFLEVLLSYCRIVALGTFGMLYYAGPKWYFLSVKNFVFIYKEKINIIPHAFLEILQRYANFLFWVIWAYLVTHTQNDTINLQKRSLFYLHARNKLHHLLLAWDVTF